MTSQAQPILPVTMSYDNNVNDTEEFRHLGHHIERNSDWLKADIDRNADYTHNQLDRTSTQGLLATQNAAVQGLLATQNAAVQGLLETQTTSTATQLAVQNTSTDTKNAIMSVSAQSERIAGETRGLLNNQVQLMLLDSKANALQLATQMGIATGSIIAQGSATQLQSADYKAAISLQASENTKDIQLQAANYKAYLENHITATSAAGILKTSETSSAILQKLAECCCESKLGHVATQNIVMQNGNNNNAAIQQGQINSLQASLAATQQEALVSRITNSIINNTTSVTNGGGVRS